MSDMPLIQPGNAVVAEIPYSHHLPTTLRMGNP